MKRSHLSTFYRYRSSLSNKSGNSTSKSNFNPLNWYANKLETHPISTKCITSGIISGGGDLLCQYLVHFRSNSNDDNNETKGTGYSGNRSSGEAILPMSKSDDARNDSNDKVDEFELDLYRTGRFLILGCFLVAPVVHFWYGSLMKYLPGSSVSKVLKRTFLDQAGFAPIFLPTFMVNLMILEGRSLKEEIPDKLRKDYPGALVTNWLLWIPAMLFNFAFVPEKYMVLYSNMIGFVWNTYLSWKTQEQDYSYDSPSQIEQGKKKR